MTNKVVVIDSVNNVVEVSVAGPQGATGATGATGPQGPAVSDGDKGDITVSNNGGTYTIDDDAVTYAKIQNVSATDRVLGRDSSGAGVIEEITPANLRTMINVEDGSTGDQTDAEIKTAYENNSNTNAYTDAEKSKLAAIEASADVTDATNVDAAGAVMNSDNTTAAMSFVIDEDNMSSDSATKVPTQQSVKAYVDTEVAGVVDSAPSALNTLNELAAALGDDANFSTTVTNSIGTKLPLAGGTMTGNIVMSGSQTVDGRDVSADGAKLDGIATGAEVNVQADFNETDNTSDAFIKNKPTIPTNNNQLTNGAGFTTNTGTVTGVSGTAPITSSGGTTPAIGISAATTSAAGSMSAADKTKLDGIETSADVTDATNVAASGAAMLTGAAFTGDISVTSTDTSSSASPEVELYRNSASPADADYLGQLKFTGESDDGSKEVYAKLTGKIDDASSGTEDGLIEFALRKAGSNNIGARLTSTDLKLINGTGLEVAGNISCDGTVDGVDIAALNTTVGNKLGNVVEDTTPQLGGNLDVQSSEITTTTTNGNIKLNPNGTGVVEVKGDGSSEDGAIQLNCSQNTHGVKIKSPAHSAGASYTLTLPTTDGNADQVLKTNGSGVLDWVDQSGGSGGVAATGGTFTGSVTFEDAINENVFAITDASSVALDPDNGMMQTWTLGANRTATDSLTAGQTMLLIVTASGSNYTVTWPTMTWVGGSAPTLGGATPTAIELFKVGSTLYGATVGNLG